MAGRWLRGPRTAGPGSKSVLLITLCLPALLAGCDSTDRGEEAGRPAPDCGTGDHACPDASGQDPQDARTGTDSATDPPDQGMPLVDSGAGPPETGVAPPDAGGPPDAGVPPDVGSLTDTGAPPDADAGSTPDDDAGSTPEQRCLGDWTPAAHAASPVAPTFRRGPYLQSVGVDHAVVVWLADPSAPVDGGVAAVEGCVEFGEPAEGLRQACASPDGQGQYAVELGGLPPGGVVRYRVRVGETISETFQFQLAPVDPTPTRLLLFGDAHANSGTLAQIAAAGLAAGVQGAVAIGDLVNQPEPAQWDAFFAGLRDLLPRVPLWPVRGNHENPPDSYYASFVLPGVAPPPYWPEHHYAVRWGNVWMAVLQLDDILFSYYMAGRQELPEVAWLRQELAGPAARGARWRLLFLHEPGWVQGWGHCDGYAGEAAVRELLVPLAAAGGADAIFSGHMHGYERGEAEGVLLVTTGGAGGALDHDCAFEGLPDPWLGIWEHHYTLVDAGCDELVVEARALDGTLLDRVEVPHR